MKKVTNRDLFAIGGTTFNTSVGIPEEVDPIPYLNLIDNRKVLASSNKAINPNRDLKTGKYNADIIRNIIRASKSSGVDPYTALAIGLQETGFGEVDDNYGHVTAKTNASPDGIDESSYDLTSTLKDKLALATRLGYKDEASQIQAYNGYGKIGKNTEKSYHNDTGRSTQRFYGVDTTTPIDLKKNPLYGKTIIDLRDNVIKKNKEIQKMVDDENNPDEAFHYTDLNKFSMGGKISNSMLKNKQKFIKMAFGGSIDSEEDQIPPGKKNHRPGLFDTNRVAFVDSVLNANKNLDWVRRLHEKNAPSMQLPGQRWRSSHFMGDNDSGLVFPTIIRENGKLQYLGKRAEDYTAETNTGIQFKTPEQGSWFAANGYKIGTGVNNIINDQTGIPYNDPNYKIDDKGHAISGNIFNQQHISNPIYKNSWIAHTEGTPEYPAPIQSIFALGGQINNSIMKNKQRLTQMAFGGDVREQKYPTGGSVSPFGDREDYYQASAKLAYYKNLLNDKLKSKDTKGYTDFFKGLKDTYSSTSPEKARRDYIQDAKYNTYLSPEEIVGTLGAEGHKRYLDAVKKVNQYNVTQGQQPLYGDIEGQNDPSLLNYGRRFASLQVTPSLSNTIVDSTTKKARTYNRQYDYDPKSDKVNYTETGDMSAIPTELKKAQTELGTDAYSRMATGGEATNKGLDAFAGAAPGILNGLVGLFDNNPTAYSKEPLVNASTMRSMVTPYNKMAFGGNTTEDSGLSEEDMQQLQELADQQGVSIEELMSALSGQSEDNGSIDNSLYGDTQDTGNNTNEQDQDIDEDDISYAMGGRVGGNSIHIKKKNRGKFTTSATKAGMSVQAYAAHVLASSTASPILKKRANFARNASRWKHAFGGPVKPIKQTPEEMAAESYYKYPTKNDKSSILYNTPSGRSTSDSAKFVAGYRSKMKVSDAFPLGFSMQDPFQAGYTERLMNTGQPLPEMIPTLKKMAFGGNTNKVPIEAEGREVLQTPGGQVGQIKGPSHENGGVDLNVPEGTNIYSKRLKIDGKSMADRKLKRERTLTKLQKLIEKNPQDKLLKNTIGRTIETHRNEEQQDMAMQKMAKHVYDGRGKMAMGGRASYAFGDENINNEYDDPYPVPGGYNIPTNLFRQSGIGNMNTIPDPSLSAGTIPTNRTIAMNSGITQEEYDRRLGNRNTANSPYTTGDYVGMAGTIAGGILPLLNTNANARATPPNINRFRGFGKDALDTNSAAMNTAATIHDYNDNDIATAAETARTRNRGSVSSLNTLNALNTATDMGADNARLQSHNAFAKQMVSLMDRRSNLDNLRDKTVMAGDTQRDIEDKADMDNYFSNRGRDLQSLANSAQIMGRNMNISQSNQDNQDLLAMLSQNNIRIGRKNGRLTVINN